MSEYPYIHPNDVLAEELADARATCLKWQYDINECVLAKIIADAQNRVIQRINDACGYHK